MSCSSLSVKWKISDLKRMFLINVDIIVKMIQWEAEVRQLRPGEGEYARHRITQQVKTDDYSSAPS